MTTASEKCRYCHETFTLKIMRQAPTFNVLRAFLISFKHHEIACKKKHSEVLNEAGQFFMGWFK